MIKFNNDWDEILESEFLKPYYVKLQDFLSKEYAEHAVYPIKENLFTAFKLTSYKDTKVVILGQDPYHNANQSHGLAFSVLPGVKVPPSLQNMYKEIHDTLGCEIPNNGYLAEWAEQGVLLLNTVMTVRDGEPNSHKGKGWENFTDSVIELLNDRKEPIVFILWGNHAKAKMKMITNPWHCILTSVHPSPLAANRGFFGCDHFRKTNEFLEANGLGAINWQISNR